MAARQSSTAGGARRTATVIAFPDTARKRLKAARERDAEVIRRAGELGMCLIGKPDQDFLKHLHELSHAGRDLVLQMVRQMVATHPYYPNATRRRGRT